MLERDELKRRFNEYMQKTRNQYIQMSYEDEFQWLEESLISFLENNYMQAYYSPLIGDSMFQQIFSGINALPNDINPFYQMMQRIEQEYGLERDIIDVSCGVFPALSYEIQKRKDELDIKKGSITAFDPRLGINTLDGVVLIKDKFTLTTPLPKNALLVGRKPCDATETIIRKSSINNLEIYIQLCHCDEHVPKAYKLSHKPMNNMSFMEIYIEDLTRSTLPTGFRVEKEKVHESVGDKPNQNSYETVIKTKRIR